jgi:5'-3' exonuclease
MVGLNNLERLIHKSSEEMFCDGFKVSVKGTSNFRDEIHPMYKKHPGRVNSKKKPGCLSEMVPQLSLLAVNEGLVSVAEHMEADDMLRIWSEEALDDGDDFIITSIDKDLRQIPGMHRNIKTGVIDLVTPQMAHEFFYSQLLQGDPTDNIPGIPKIGPKRASKMIAEACDEIEMRIIVVEAYREAFGDLWEENLLFNGRLLYLLKHYDDCFNIDDWIIL